MNTFKNTFSVIAIALIATLFLFGSAYAGASSQVTLSGTVGWNGKLIQSNGQAFTISNADAGTSVQTLIGKKVQVKGTVMDGAAGKTIDVHEYYLLGFDGQGD